MADWMTAGEAAVLVGILIAAVAAAVDLMILFRRRNRW